MSTWTVVEFSDQSVEAVPTSWVINNECSWPQYPRERVLKAIKQSEVPGSNWAKHEVKIFRNATYDNYIVARRKALKAEDTSELSSGCDNKRMPKKTPRLISESGSDISEDSSSEDTCPKIVIRKGESQSVVERTNSGLSHIDLSQAPSNCGNVPKPVKENSANIIVHNSEVTQRNSVRCECTCCPVHKSNGLLQEIFRKITFIELRLNELNTKLNTPNNNGLSVNVDVWNDFNMPLKNIPELETFEDFLKIEDNINQSASYLAKIGGDTADEFTKRALRKLMTFELATNFSFQGLKGKQIFRNLNIYKLLINASKVTTYTEKELENSVKKFLKRAKERSRAEQHN